jgi:hypothetical protein
VLPLVPACLAQLRFLIFTLLLLLLLQAGIMEFLLQANQHSSAVSLASSMVSAVGLLTCA